MKTLDSRHYHEEVLKRIARQADSDARLRRSALAERYFQGDEQWVIEELVERDSLEQDIMSKPRKLREWLPLRIWGGLTLVKGLRRLRQSKKDRIKRGKPETRLRLRNVSSEQIVMG